MQGKSKSFVYFRLLTTASMYITELYLMNALCLNLRRPTSKQKCGAGWGNLKPLPEVRNVNILVLLLEKSSNFVHSGEPVFLLEAFLDIRCTQN